MSKMGVEQLQERDTAAQLLVDIEDTLCSITIGAAKKSEGAADRIGWLMWVVLASAVGLSVFAVVLLFLGHDVVDLVTQAIGALVTGTVWVALKATKAAEETHAQDLRKEAKGYCPAPAAT
jgi:hypothetical protein